MALVRVTKGNWNGCSAWDGSAVVRTISGKPGMDAVRFTKLALVIRVTDGGGMAVVPGMAVVRFTSIFSYG